MMALHQIRDVRVGGQEGLSLNLRLASKTPLRRRSIMGLSERRHHCIKHRKHPPPRSTHETKNDHVKAALSLSPRPAREHWSVATLVPLRTNKVLFYLTYLPTYPPSILASPIMHASFPNWTE